jgi:hypothetical protein
VPPSLLCRIGWITRGVFVDYFYEHKHYGELSDFKEYLDGLNLAQVEVKPLGELMPVPFLLKHPRVFGRVGMIHGVK